METAADRFANYEICGLLRQSPGSACFAAIHPGLGRGLKADRKVALELAWDLTYAEQEARRLLQLNGKNGFPLLYDYLLIPCQLVADMLATLHQPDAIAGSQGQEIAVLVTQFAQGQELVNTAALDKKPRRVPQGSWLVEVDGKSFCQSMAGEIDLNGKIKVLRNLIKLVRQAHEQEPPQVCGELHPGCLWYDGDASGQVRFVARKVPLSYEALAWQSPWHLQNQGTLPAAADIYQLALWVRRVLGGEDRAWRSFADAILRQRQAEKLPTIDRFERDFNRTAVKVVSRMDLSTRVLVGLGLGALLAASLFWLWRFYQLSPKKSEIARLQMEAKKGDAAAEEVIAKLRGYLGEKEYQPVRQELVESIGQIRLEQPLQTRFLAAIDWSKPSAVYASRADSFVIYQGFAFQIGTAVSADEYIADIQATGLRLAHRDGKRQKIEFPKHPLVNGDGEGQFIIYASDLWEIITALSHLGGARVNYCSFLRPRIFGLIIEDNPSLVLDNIVMSMDYRLDPTGLVENRKWYGFWDLREGTALKGDLGHLTQERLGKLGLKVTGAEHLHRSVDVVLKRRTRFLDWLKQEAMIEGVRMELSEDGRSVRFYLAGART